MWVIHLLSLYRKSFLGVLVSKVAVFLYYCKLNICSIFWSKGLLSSFVFYKYTYHLTTVVRSTKSIVHSKSQPSMHTIQHSNTFLHMLEAQWKVCTPTWVILLWLAKNIERFWDSWMDWGSAIFLKNWAALEVERKRNVNLAPATIFRNDFFICGSLPFVGGVIVLNATLHVLQFVQHCKHVNKFAQREQVGLRHKVLPSLSVTQTLYFTTETLYGFPLQRQRRRI